ncbi:MAG: hypothetical protein ACOX5Z_03335 [Desulfobulbus sp.]|jgi:hypothetical protein
MKTFREKISFVLTALAYLLFHLRLAPELDATVRGTLYQLLLTAPYAAGFTFIVTAVFRRLSTRGRLPWDRICRIFFTFGILFGFFFGLYEYAGGKMPEPGQSRPMGVERFFGDAARKGPSYWA